MYYIWANSSQAWKKINATVRKPLRLFSKDNTL